LFEGDCAETEVVSNATDVNAVTKKNLICARIIDT
jgi:hypothetical protein